jgi:hypothetical protein
LDQCYSCFVKSKPGVRVVRNTIGQKAVGGQNVNWNFHVPVFLGMLGGAVLVTVVELRPLPQGLRDAALVVGGALVGLISLWLDEVLRTAPERRRLEQQRVADSEQHERERTDEREQHETDRAEDQQRIEKLHDENRRLLELSKASEDRDRIRSETEAQSAYTLALLATTLPTKTGSVPVAITSICSDLGLRFSETEQKVLETPPASQTDAHQISGMLLTKGHALPQRLWCFFELGNRAPWLKDLAESGRSTKTATDWLETFRRNPFLPFAPSFVEVIDELLGAFRPYYNGLPDDARESLKRSVTSAFTKISYVYIQSRGTLTPYRRSPWFFVGDHGIGVLVCIVDTPNAPGNVMLGVRDANTYELSKLEDHQMISWRVTRDDSGWRCSAHPNASSEDACLDIRIVVALTDDGNPPTKAEVVVCVPREPDTAPPDSGQAADSNG